MQIVVLAGGLGTRLRPLTQQIPKALVPVCGRPFIEYQLERFHSQGIRDIVLCVGHLGHLIEAHLGDGQRFGVRIRYSREGERLLGTGGAIKRAEPWLADPFFVQYGDSYLRVDYRAVAAAFRKHDRLGLMVVYRNENRWDRSNVVVEDGFVTVYDKWERSPGMKYIDYGVSLFRKAALAEIPRDEEVDLSVLLQRLIARRQLLAYETDQRFYEVGSPAGLKEFESFVASGGLEQLTRNIMT